jgi:uncharacterized protein YkwD
VLTLRRTIPRAITRSVVLAVVATAGLGALAPAAQAADAGARWRKPALLAPGPAPAPTVTTVTTVAAPSLTTSPTAAYETEVLRLVNVERAKAGLRPVSRSTCAEGYARTWSQTMARTGTFAHQSLTPIMSGCKARGAGENIGYGNVTPAQMMTMWMNSSGHRANVLRASFTHLGVGAAVTSTGRWYVTQDFLTL